MMLQFYKMTGAGNDFVMIDNRDLSLSELLTRDNIAALCDRRFGIGADGLIAVEPAQGQGDVRMRYYNSDGGEAEMCGNGARCFTAFVEFLTDGQLRDMHFETIAGLVRGTVNDDDSVTIQLTTPKDLKLNALPADDVIPAPVHFLNTGVPHAVAYLPSVDDIDIRKMGAYLRYHKAFAPAGTNANFATVLSPQHLKLRTYERGVEDETLACGTGMTATALLHALLTDAPSPISLDVAGGDTLSVGFKRVGATEFRDVTLTGPALIVFRGEVIL
ncbi:MAG TPA: diaminopimelate epimerase [Candidatus Akkermansia intestinigallinarum]|uniref:Diaminopimelate epimerase n=1 Tax=Candidatus Akkermansia intestinigallinarum TaxID=2838431 RepID=A0A9D1VAZ4_9BACT|nr:diaminopimelate epimerase [Candidatus Akkermansia intestinigallinarum]